MSTKKGDPPAGLDDPKKKRGRRAVTPQLKVLKHPTEGRLAAKGLGKNPNLPPQKKATAVIEWTGGEKGLIQQLTKSIPTLSPGGGGVGPIDPRHRRMWKIGNRWQEKA